LFAGLHKTGSTSIQETCGSNLDLVVRAGFEYPRWSVRSADGSVHNDNNQSSLLSRLFHFTAPARSLLGPSATPPSDEEIKKGMEVRRSVLRESIANRRSNLLFVAEEVSRFTFGELVELRKFFESMNLQIQVLCFVRKPSPWLTSMTAQTVAGNRSVRGKISTFVSSVKFDHELIVPSIWKLKKAFPEISFHSFDAAVAHPRGPVGYFFEKAEIDLGSGLKIVRANEGLSDTAVRVNEAINARVGSLWKSKEVYEFYRKLYSRYPALKKIPGPKFALRADEVRPAIPVMEEENAWLKKNLGAGFYEERVTFSTERPLLDEAGRRFLVEHLASADGPVGEAVKAYLAEH
jgi:hypothetical protein